MEDGGKTMDYSFQKIEPKWQAKWEEEGIFHAKDFSEKPKFYGLVEFPYPSGAGMHVGHIKAYSSIEVISRNQHAPALHHGQEHREVLGAVKARRLLF